MTPAPERSGLREQVIAGLGWSMLQSWGSRILTFAFFVVLARLLAPSDFGSVALVYVIYAVLATFPEAGLSDTLIRRKDNAPSHYDTAFWFMVAMSLVLWGATALAAPWIAGALDQPRLEALLVVLGVTLPLQAGMNVHEAVLRRSMLFRSMALRTLLAALAGGAVGIGMAFAGFGHWSLAGKGLVEAAAGALLTWRASPYRPGRAISRASWNELFGVARHLLLARVIDLLNTRLDSLIVGTRIGPAALGLYSAAQRMHQTMMEALFATVNRVTLPAFAQLGDEPERRQHALLRLGALCSFFSFPLFAAVALLAEPLMVLLFGEPWRGAAPMLSAFAIVGVLTSVTSFNSPMIVAAGRTDYILLLTAANGGVNAIGFWIGAQWGALGVAIAYAVRAYLVMPLNLWLLHRTIRLPIGGYLRNLAPSLAGTAAACALLWLVRRALPQGWPDAVQLVVQGAVLAAGYLAAMPLLFPRRTADVLREVAGLWPLARPSRPL